MRIAREADVPVVLVADVDRGGALAAVVGTLELVGTDMARVRGIIFNKFRGDIGLFRDAVTWTENYTGVHVLGVLPYLEGVDLPAEDSLSLKNYGTRTEHGTHTANHAFDTIAKALRENLNVQVLLQYLSV